MTDALFRVALPTGPRLARGTIDAGPQELLPAGLGLDDLLASGGPGLASAFDLASPGRCPAQAPWLAPIEGQEVWCSGVTYARTHEARAVTATEPSIYDRLYTAERPELFFKAPGWRVRGPGEAVAIRPDSGWDMAEPELGLVIAADGAIAGYVIGNDMTSRAIERDNPLYLPQAKVYDGGCALGPAITPAGAARSAVPRPYADHARWSGRLRRRDEHGADGAAARRPGGVAVPIPVVPARRGAADWVRHRAGRFADAAAG